MKKERSSEARRQQWHGGEVAFLGEKCCRLETLVFALAGEKLKFLDEASALRAENSALKAKNEGLEKTISNLKERVGILEKELSSAEEEIDRMQQQG
ncbi:MAG: hypothetical protein NTY33_01985 [Candidatus Moranbacteria bacterium]|nr:hypothetical protein [Candidatus Moranbacteria bacterium]